MKIIIDSGHGGDDPGAVAFGTFEKDININIATRLSDALEEKGYEVDRSLINDINYDSQTLTSLIRDSEAALCVSCHNNAANGSARGLEVIHSIHSDGTLANEISSQVETTGYIVRSAYSRESYVYPGNDYYFIIRETYPTVETIIVEFGFMDNIDDFNMLMSDEWQNKLTSAVADAVSIYLPLPVAVKTPIMGENVVSANKLKNALLDNNTDFETSIVDEYIKIASDYGVKGDLAFCQCIIETNWLQFDGIVSKEQNNFCGLGATGNNETGASFPTISDGVEAHIQHLYAYASADPLPEGKIIIDPRFKYVTRGIAPNIEDLNGKWAVPGEGYGESISTLLDSIEANYSDVINEGPPAHWAQICNDELIDAGILYDDHSKTLDQPATEAMVICLINRLRKEFLK